MPQLVPLVLQLQDDPLREETYDPVSNNGADTIFVDSSPEQVYDNREIRVTVRPAAAGNTGRVTETLIVAPIPLTEDGCCTDVTKPEGNTLRITSMVRKTSSKAQAMDMVLRTRAYVNSAAFALLVTKEGFF